MKYTEKNEWILNGKRKKNRPGIRCTQLSFNALQTLTSGSCWGSYTLANRELAFEHWMERREKGDTARKKKQTQRKIGSNFSYWNCVVLCLSKNRSSCIRAEKRHWMKSPGEMNRAKTRENIWEKHWNVYTLSFLFVSDHIWASLVCINQYTEQSPLQLSTWEKKQRMKK